MFRPFRLLVLGALALAIYSGFFATPGGKTETYAFDPDQVAGYETEAWRAAKGHNEFSTFTNTVLMLREEHRMTWARAVQSAYSRTMALDGFVGLTSHYEHVLPDLQDAASSEQAANNLTFDPVAVARQELDWMMIATLPNQGDTGQMATIMAEEYGLRFNVRPDYLYAAAPPRAEAFKMWATSSVDPDYAAINKLLVESYRSLRTGLERAHAPRAAID